MTTLPISPGGGLSRATHRAAVGVLFFLQGICFASWASRIPAIQQKLGISEAGLGAVLLCLPLGQLLTLPLAGWAVAKKGSRQVMLYALSSYALVLAALGWAGSVWQLVPALVLFGAAGNFSNIAVNTQAVGV